MVASKVVSTLLLYEILQGTEVFLYFDTGADPIGDLRVPCKTTEKGKKSQDRDSAPSLSNRIQTTSPDSQGSAIST